MLFEIKDFNFGLAKNKEFEFVSHLHHDVEIRLCTKGTLGAICKDERKILSPGDLMIVFSNEVHEYFETDGGEGYILFFKPDISELIKKRIAENKFENFLSKKELIPVFDKLYDEYCNKRDVLVMYGYINVIAGEIFKDIEKTEKSDTYSDDLLSKSLKYISENYKKTLTLKSVSKELGVTNNHLCRLFSKKIPGGFHNYIKVLRVQEACNLLKNTNLNIYEVMYSSGFSNQRTFLRAFKEEKGVSPKEYRKSQLKKINDC